MFHSRTHPVPFSCQTPQDGTRNATTPHPVLPAKRSGQIGMKNETEEHARSTVREKSIRSCMTGPGSRFPGRAGKYFNPVQIFRTNDQVFKQYVGYYLLFEQTGSISFACHQLMNSIREPRKLSIGVTDLRDIRRR